LHTALAWEQDGFLTVGWHEKERRLCVVCECVDERRNPKVEEALYFCSSTARFQFSTMFEADHNISIINLGVRIASSLFPAPCLLEVRPPVRPSCSLSEKAQGWAALAKRQSLSDLFLSLSLLQFQCGPRTQPMKMCR
jgi:hypothetical protein